MRIVAAKAIRVFPGDEVYVHGELPSTSKLSRLYVFARQGRMEFAPYVQNLEAKIAVAGLPQMMFPVMFRVTQSNPISRISFVSDLNGWVQVVQEIDNAREPRAKVRLKRRICSDLPWITRIQRRLSGIWSWNR